MNQVSNEEIHTMISKAFGRSGADALKHHRQPDPQITVDSLADDISRITTDPKELTTLHQKITLYIRNNPDSVGRLAGGLHTKAGIDLAVSNTHIAERVISLFWNAIDLVRKRT